MCFQNALHHQIVSIYLLFANMLHNLQDCASLLAISGFSFFYLWQCMMGTAKSWPLSSYVHWIPLKCNLNNWGQVNDVLNGIKFLSHCRGRPCFIWSLIEARTCCTTHVVHCWQGTIECHSSPKHHQLFGKAMSTSRRWPDYNPKKKFTLSHGDNCQVAKKYLMVW